MFASQLDDPRAYQAPVIISSSDVRWSGAPVAETDCGLTVETDCACADQSPGSGTAGTMDLATPYALPELYFGELPEGYTLAANPVSGSGVTILNQPALKLLQSFRRPRRLDEAPDGDHGHQMARAARRFAELGLLRPLGVVAPAQSGMPRTLTAWMHVTNACNLRCDYCYLAKTPDAMEVARGRQAVEAVVRSAVANGFKGIKLKYAGGEATLNFPLVTTLHAYARELAARHGLDLDGVVLSNGVALGGRVLRGLQASGLRLMISLDGVGALHDSQRHFANNRGSFAPIERSLGRLAEHGIVPSISITISRRNLPGLADTVAYVLDRGLPFALNFFRENDCAASHGDLAYQDDEVIAAMRAAFQVIEQRLPRHSLLGSLLDRARLDAPHARPCGVGQSYLVVDQHGGVAKCHMAIEQLVTDISVADPLRRVREDNLGLQNYAVEEKEGCKTCAWRYLCAGGCPALTYRVTGRFDVKSPNCRIYQALFPDVLRLEGLRLLHYGVAAARAA